MTGIVFVQSITTPVNNAYIDVIILYNKIHYLYHIIEYYYIYSRPTTAKMQKVSAICKVLLIVPSSTIYYIYFDEIILYY